MRPPDPTDAPKSIGAGGRRVWLYPEWLRGVWMTRRTTVHTVLLALLLIGPWVDIDGRAAIRFDIPGRRIDLFGLHMFASDGAYLLFAFGALIFSVFLFTALFGRAWCGWACPQTVFLESLVRPWERLVEGSAHARTKLDRSAWTGGKLVRKTVKYAGYLVISGAVGTTFTAYFLGRSGTLEAQLHPFSHPAGTFTFLFITGLLFFDFSWFREQTCLVVCPYGRFQSALLDRHSLTVLYDDHRGEPRGKKGTLGAGDCVDCRKCVQVCPTGTDIRNGSTMECVQCMACIDACDDVMERLGRKHGLVRIGSLAGLDGERTKIVRTRTAIYGGLLIAVLVAAGVGIALHRDVAIGVTHQVGAPYVALGDGRVQNALQLRIENRSDHARTFEVEVVSPDRVELVAPVARLEVPADTTKHMPVFLLRAQDDIAAARELVVLRVHEEGTSADTRVELEFLSGGPR